MMDGWMLSSIYTPGMCQIILMKGNKQFQGQIVGCCITEKQMIPISGQSLLRHHCKEFNILTYILQALNQRLAHSGRETMNGDENQINISKLSD